MNINNYDAGIIKLIEAARSIKDKYRREQALTAIAPHIPENLWSELLEHRFSNQNV